MSNFKFLISDSRFVLLAEVVISVEKRIKVGNPAEPRHMELMDNPGCRNVLDRTTGRMNIFPRDGCTLFDTFLIL